MMRVAVDGEWSSYVDALQRLPVGRLQYLVLGLVMFVCFADGFDSAAISVAAPLMKVPLGLTAPQLGASFSATLLGGMISLVIAGPAADRFGRRPIMLLATGWFTLWTALTPHAWDGTSLFLIRLMAGLGLGPVTSVGYTMVGEYSPRRLTSRMVTSSAAGYVIGTIVAGVVGAVILRVMEWKSLFYIGAGLGMVSFISLFLWLPESPPFLVEQPDQLPFLKTLLSRISPALASIDFVIAGNAKKKLPSGLLKTMINLFAGGRAIGVLAFWLFTFMILLEQIFLVQWLPFLLTSVGTSIEISSLASSALQLGALIGTIGLAMVLDAVRHRYIVMLVAVVSGGVLMVVLGHSTHGGVGMLLVAILAGIGVIGPAIANPSLLVRFFPAQVRSTGMTLNNAVGRIGATLGPIIGGYLIQSGMAPGSLISWMAFPAVVAVAALFVLHRVHNAA